MLYGYGKGESDETMRRLVDVFWGAETVASTINVASQMLPEKDGDCWGMDVNCKGERRIYLAISCLEGREADQHLFGILLLMHM